MDPLIELTKLAKKLETKRQTSNLTDQEQAILKNIDNSRQNVVNQNLKSSSKIAKDLPDESTYRISTGEIVHSKEGQRVGYIPNISSEQADEIISKFNEQFQEKVMSKIHKSDPSNIQNNLSAASDDRPLVPFADEDSSFDLSKLVK